MEIAESIQFNSVDELMSGIADPGMALYKPN